MIYGRIGAALLAIWAVINPASGLAQAPHEVKTKIIADVYEGPSLQMAEQRRAVEELQSGVQELLADRKALRKEREAFHKVISEIKADHQRFKARIEELETEIKQLREEFEPDVPVLPSPTDEGDARPPIAREAPRVSTDPKGARDEGERETSEPRTDSDAARANSRPLEREFVVEGATFRAPWFENEIGPLRKRIRRYAGHDGNIGNLAVSPDGDWGASVGQGGVLRIWNWHDSSGHGVIRLDGRGMTAIAFAPDSDRLAVAGWDRLFLLEVDPLRVLWSADCDGISRRESLDFSADGGLLASRAQEQLTVWDAKTGEQLRSSKLPWKGNFLCGFDLLDDTTLFIAGGSYESGNRIPDDKAKLVDIGTGEILWELIFPRDPYSPQDAVLMPDRKHIITAEYHSGTIDVWDVETGFKSTWEDTQRTSLMELSESGEILITAGPANVTAWHVPTGKIIEEYRMPDYEEQGVGAPDMLAIDGQGRFALFTAPLKNRTVTYCRFRTKLALYDYEHSLKKQ